MISFSKQNLLDSVLNSKENNIVFRYNGNPPFLSNTHHVFVIVSRIVDSDDLILVCGTSQLDTVLNYLKKVGIDNNKTTVRISSQKYKFFPKDTIINCNSVYVINKSDIEINSFEYVKNGSLCDDDFALIKQAIVASPIVEPYIKNAL